MAGGSAKPRNFYTGAVLLQPASALDAFVGLAQAGNEFVFAEAPEEPRGADCWARARELDADGLVRNHRRRRAGGGWQFFLVRTTKGLPRQLSAEERALADRATRIIFDQLKREANMGQACSSDAALMRLAGLTMRQQAGQRVRKLIDARLIESEVHYVAGVPARVVTIAAGKFAGAAAGKATAIPRQRSVAERLGREADEREIRRLREAGL